MEKLPVKAKIYIALLLPIAIFISCYLFTISSFSNIDYFSLFVFLVVIVLSESLPITMPHGGIITISFAPIMAAILLFEPIFVIALEVLSEILYIRKDKTLPKFLFNSSQLVISIGTASLLYNYLNPDGLALTWQCFIAAIVSVIVAFLLNWVLLTLMLAFVQNTNPFLLWIVNIKWAVPSFFCMAPLGILIAFIYFNIGFWGLILFILPLFLARYSFISFIKTRQNFLDTIESLSKTLDAKDPYTRGHSSRVAELSVELARELKWPEDKVELLKYIALIHDVGKVAIPERILKKAGALTKEEFDEMKTHSGIGAEVIKNNNFFPGGAAMIKHHHERWDGTGYPDGLKGEEIPEGARILAVADAFDAMTSDRPYRRAMDPATALQEIREGAGSQFDPRMAEAFTRVFHRLNLGERSIRKDEPVLYGEQAAASLVRESTEEKNGTPQKSC